MKCNHNVKMNASASDVQRAMRLMALYKTDRRTSDSFVKLTKDIEHVFEKVYVFEEVTSWRVNGNQVVDMHDLGSYRALQFTGSSSMEK